MIATSAKRKIVNLLDDWDALCPAWDRFVQEHPKGSIFHASPMVRVFEAAKGHQVLPLAAVDPDGEILAILVAVRVQTLPDPLGRFSSRSILYAEPLCRDDGPSIDALAQLVVWHDRRMGRRVLFTEVRPLWAPGPERVALERCGYEFLDYLNFVLDLTQPADALWRNLRSSARRGIRKCEQNGYHVRHVDTPDGVDLLYRFLQLSYGHAQVPLAHRSLFDAAFEILHPRGNLKLIAVYDGDEPTAMDALLTYKDQAYAWYGGAERVPSFSPGDYLTWQELLWSQEQGCRWYDFAGAGWPDEPYGVRDYKAKFGGELVHYGRYRKICSPWKLALAEKAYDIGRSAISPKQRG